MGLRKRHNRAKDLPAKGESVEKAPRNLFGRES
jgi:hypothetical protein